ncbi:MAG: nucleotidyltransferase family protein, partial [Nitrospiraceae bacterium]|nr:nucleotidyltransferase family protein [Nitrospiraceae bacterium]
MPRAAPILGLIRAFSQDRRDLELAAFDDQTLTWAQDVGIGPLLLRTVGLTRQNAPSSTHRKALLSADLTARVLCGMLLDATEEVLDSASENAHAITLLKGISICEDLYPEPHLRTMGDIDLLVDPGMQRSIECLLYKLGYHQRSEYPPEFYVNHHHSMPFYHLERPICIEVHTSLFPVEMTVARDKVFLPEYVGRQRVSFVFRGHLARRLRPELQLVYICSHMAERLTWSREPLAFIDLILLLRKYGTELDWENIVSSLEGTVAASHTYVLLSYLSKHGLARIPPQVLEVLRTTQKCVNRITLPLLHRIIDRYLLRRPLFTSVATKQTVGITWATLLRPRHPL